MQPLFVGVNNEPLPIVAMRVNDPDRSPLAIHCCDTAPSPTGFAEFVGNQFPGFHAGWILPFLFFTRQRQSDNEK
jgi:hypothetical protein